MTHKGEQLRKIEMKVNTTITVEDTVKSLQRVYIIGMDPLSQFVTVNGKYSWGVTGSKRRGEPEIVIIGKEI